MIRYLDVCSGYSAFTLANAGLDYNCVGYSEIEAFPRAVLQERHGAVPVDWDHEYQPETNVTPLFGDFTKIEAHHVGPVQLLAGGTPCQAFSVAGKRLGLDDPRGNLTLEFLALARRLRVEWLVWENVPGFLSHDGGRTMGTFLRLLGELGYGWAYRVLDAQFIRVDGAERAVPQRRRRLFVVAHLGDAAGPASVLFERESLRGHPAPRRESGEGFAAATAPSLVSSGRGVERTGETRGQGPVIAVPSFAIQERAVSENPNAGPQGKGFQEGIAYTLEAGHHVQSVAFGGGNFSGQIDKAACLTAKGQKLDFEVETFVAELAGTMPAGGNATGGTRQPGTSAETAGSMLVAESSTYAINSDALDRSGEGAGGSAAERAGLGVQADVGYSMRAKRPDAVAYRITPNDGAYETGSATGSLTTGTDRSAQAVVQEWAVRRLTPTECERLMGVPDGFTRVTYRGKPAADGPRYKALGNSQAVNVMRWIAIGLRQTIDAQSGGLATSPAAGQ